MIPLPSSVTLHRGLGHLPTLNVEAAGGSGKIHLDGAHLTSWQPHGHKPVLWMSAESRFASGQPVRGGVPICFPWFNIDAQNPEAPQHGFARISKWELLNATESGDSITVTFRLRDSGSSRSSSWPHLFETLYTITIGPSLRLELTVQNRDEEAVTFEAALHNYYSLGDLAAAYVGGLEGKDFYEDFSREPQQDLAPVRLSAKINRRYPLAREAIIVDPANSREIIIYSEGFSGSVLWNPGPDDAKALPDFGNEEWSNMVCFETASIAENAITLPAGGQITLSARVSVRSGAAQ